MPLRPGSQAEGGGGDPKPSSLPGGGRVTRREAEKTDPGGVSRTESKGDPHQQGPGPVGHRRLPVSCTQIPLDPT